MEEKVVGNRGGQKCCYEWVGRVGFQWARGYTSVVSCVGMQAVGVSSRTKKQRYCPVQILHMYMYVSPV